MIENHGEYILNEIVMLSILFFLFILVLSNADRYVKFY